MLLRDMLIMIFHFLIIIVIILCLFVEVANVQRSLENKLARIEQLIITHNRLETLND